MVSRLTFIRETKVIEYKNSLGKIKTRAKYGLYKCSCGNEKEISISNVNSGRQLSCGCYGIENRSKIATTHGLSKHPLFKIWGWMRTRCQNPNATHYKEYGGRGVKVCKEWNEDFKKFYDWAIENGWEKSLELDKDSIPNKMGIKALLYSPKYCCFVTKKENCNNRRSNKIISYNGISKTMQQWSELLGFNEDVLYNRFKYGWSVEKAITTPVRVNGKNKHLYGNI